MFNFLTPRNARIAAGALLAIGLLVGYLLMRKEPQPAPVAPVTPKPPVIESAPTARQIGADEALKQLDSVYTPRP